MGEQFADFAVFVFAVHVRAEADAAFFGALADDFVQTGKRAAADKQNVGRIDIDELLVRVAAAALLRHAGHSAFDEFEQCLLHAFARHVARDGWAVALTRDFVDFVNINNAVLRFFHVEIAVAQQLGDDSFHVFTHIARFGQRGGVGHGEGHVQLPRQRLHHIGFARTSRANHQHVGFVQLHAAVGFGLAQAFVVVIYGDGQRFFGIFLADNVFV